MINKVGYDIYFRIRYGLVNAIKTLFEFKKVFEFVWVLWNSQRIFCSKKNRVKCFIILDL